MLRSPLVCLLLCLSTLIITAAEMPAWKVALQPPDDHWRGAEQHFRFNNSAEPQTLDPHLMTGVPEGNLAEALFEGLTTLHPQTLEPKPGVATSWEVSEDGLVYVFRLRPEARWSDGRPVTAHDFVWSWRRILTPETGSQYANLLYVITGAESYHRGMFHGEAAWKSVGIKALDDHTLRIQLAGPCPYFLSLTAFHTLMPAPRLAVEAHGDAWIKPGMMVGNGPFVLEAWQPRQHIVLTPNPHYWDRAFVKLERITAYPYDDQETAYKLFQQGKLDWINAVPLERLDTLKHDPDYYVSPYLSIYYLRLNVTHPKLQDVRVRKALAYAIDRRQLTDHILRAGEIPCAWFCPEGTAGYTRGGEMPEDRDRARQLLAEAGFADGVDFPSLRILYNTSERHKTIVENIAHQWNQVLGIQAQAQNTEWKVYLARLKALDYEVGRSGWVGDYNDPNTFFSIWVTGDGNNRTGWGDPAYDALVERAAAEPNPAKRLELFRDMDRMLIDQVPGIPLFVYVNQGMLAERVVGWFPNVRDLHPFQYIYIDPIE